MGLGSEKAVRLKYYLSAKANKTVVEQLNGSPKEVKKLIPHFKVQRKNEVGIIVDCPDEREVGGDLIGLSHGEFTWEGKPQKKIKIHLAENEREFIVEFSVNSALGRNVMNRIANLPKADCYMEIRMYAAKSKKDGKMGANVVIEIDGQRLDWRYDYEKELKPMVQMVPDPDNPGKQRAVYHQVNDKLLGMFIKIEEHLKTVNASKPPEPAKTVVPTETGKTHGSAYPPSGPPVDDVPPPPEPPELDDDLPF